MLNRLRIMVGRAILWFAMPAFADGLRRMTPEDWAEVDPTRRPIAEPVLSRDDMQEIVEGTVANLRRARQAQSGGAP